MEGIGKAFLLLCAFVGFVVIMSGCCCGAYVGELHREGVRGPMTNRTKVVVDPDSTDPEIMPGGAKIIVEPMRKDRAKQPPTGPAPK